MNVIITVILWIIVRFIPAFINTLGEFSFGIRVVILFGCLFGGWGIAELLSKNKHNSCIRINYLIFLFLEVIGGYNAYSSTYRAAWLAGMEKSSQFISYATSLFFCELFYIGSCFVIARLKRKRPESPAECDDVLHQPETDTSTGRPSEIGESAGLVAVPQIEAEAVIPSELSGETEDFGSKIRFCNICGFELIEGSLFCSKCGAPVVMQKNVCPRCGNELADGSVFCNRCGSKVSNDVQTAEAPQKPAETALQEVEIPAVKPKVTPPKAEENYIYDVAASGRMVRIPASQHAQWREMQDKIKNGTLSEQEKKALQDRQEELSKALIKSNGDSAPVSFNPFTQVFPDGTVQHLNVVRETDANMPLEIIINERLFDQNPSVEKRNDNERKATNAIILYLAFIAIAIILVVVVALNGQSGNSIAASQKVDVPSSTSESTAKESILFEESVSLEKSKSFDKSKSLLQQPYPENGNIFMGENLQRKSQFTVKSSTKDACYVKLKDENSNKCFEFFVCPLSTVTIDVPECEYTVVVASGRKWYGPDALFGPDTVYAKVPATLDFSKYTYECSIAAPVSSNISRMNIPFVGTPR